MNIIYCIIIIICILICVYCAKLIANTAVKKGYNVKEMHLWAICFWFGILGYFYVFSLPDKITREQNQQIIKLLEKDNDNLL